MTITINGSGTVTGVSVGGLPDGIVDAGTLASNSVVAAKIASNAVETAKINANAVTAAKRGEGAILQVVAATNTTNVTVTSSTYTTFITQDITPVAQNSKFIVVVTTGIYMSESGSQSHFGGGWTLSRNIGGGSITGLVGDPQDSNGPYGHFYYNMPDLQVGAIDTRIGYDSPNTTSTVTYYAEGRPYYGTGNQIIFGQTSDTQMVIYEVAGS